MSSIKLYQMLVRKWSKMNQTAWHHICYYYYFINLINSLNKFNRNLFFLFFLNSLLLNCVNCGYKQSHSCQENYLKYEPNHTACKIPRDNCTIIKVSHFLVLFPNFIFNYFKFFKFFFSHNFEVRSQ